MVYLPHCEQTNKGSCQIPCSVEDYIHMSKVRNTWWVLPTSEILHLDTIQKDSDVLKDCLTGSPSRAVRSGTSEPQHACFSS